MLVDFQAIVDDLVRDPDEVISTGDRDQAIAAAVLQYSADRPREVTVDVTQDTTGYRLDLPAGWISDVSELVSVEYPVGETPSPSYVDRAEISIYRAPSGQQISLPVEVSAGETVRLTYTAQHTVDASTDTIRTDHRDAVAALAGAILCQQLAAHYASDSAPTIGADSADHRTKTDRWRSLGKDLVARYERVARVSAPKGPKAAISFADLDRLAQDGGDRIFHGRRRR